MKTKFQTEKISFMLFNQIVISFEFYQIYLSSIMK